MSTSVQAPVSIVAPEKTLHTDESDSSSSHSVTTKYVPRMDNCSHMTDTFGDDFTSPPKQQLPVADVFESNCSGRRKHTSTSGVTLATSEIESKSKAALLKSPQLNTGYIKMFVFKTIVT